MRDRTTHIVLHTAAWPGDPSAEDIRRVHVEENGWEDIGYHYVIRKDGTIEPGRNEDFVGAHCAAAGMNHKSIGICMSGHGDQEGFTGDQMMALHNLVSSLREEYDIPVDNVIGHREAGARKTCPGTQVDMNLVRAYLQTSPTVDEAPDLAANEPPAADLRSVPAQEFDEDLYMGPGSGKKKFSETRLGRIASGKSTAGKLIYGAGAAAASVFAGINIGPATQLITGNPTGDLLSLTTGIMELDIWNIALIAIGMILTLVVNRQLLKGILNDIAIELQSVIEAVQTARQADSPGGKSITPEERKIILKEADDIAVLLWNRILRSRLLRFFGLQKKPDKG